jgi:hypothetical protein
MSGGKLVKILLKTRVSRYLEWKSKLILMKVLMELMFSKLNKKDFSVKEELRLKRYLLQTPKH